MTDDVVERVARALTMFDTKCLGFERYRTFPCHEDCGCAAQAQDALAVLRSGDELGGGLLILNRGYLDERMAIAAAQAARQASEEMRERAASICDELSTSVGRHWMEAALKSDVHRDGLEALVQLAEGAAKAIRALSVEGE